MILRRTTQSILHATRVFARDTVRGLLEVGHSSMALIGLLVVATLLLAVNRAGTLHDGEAIALGWLSSRFEQRAERDGNLLVALAEPDAVKRATAADPRALTPEQAALTQLITRRYRVAPEPISRLVQEAWRVGERAGIDPTLILAIMAVESGFNPFAQSAVGAQGLMQVMTRVHDDKFTAFGGNHAAFDPVSNLRVGVQILKECIARAGGIEEGLRYYVGAANLPDDGGYGAKVLGEQQWLQQARRSGAGVRVADATLRVAQR